MSIAQIHRSVLVIGGAVLLVIVAALVVVLVWGADRPHDFPPDSPEGVVQRYLTAYDNREFERAYGEFSASAQAQMPVTDYVRNATTRATYDDPQSSRVLVDQVERNADRATVTVTVEQWNASGLDTSRYAYQRRVLLARESGVWKIEPLMYRLDPVPLTPKVSTP